MKTNGSIGDIQRCYLILVILFTTSAATAYNFADADKTAADDGGLRDYLVLCLKLYKQMKSSFQPQTTDNPNRGLIKIKGMKVSEDDGYDVGKTLKELEHGGGKELEAKTRQLSAKHKVNSLANSKMAKKFKFLNPALKQPLS